MATPSEGANPLQVSVTLDSAGPAVGEMAHLALAGMVTVEVVVSGDLAVGCVGLTEEGPEDTGEAVWWVARAVQPVAAKAAANTTAMIRAWRMATSLCRTTTLWVQDSSVAKAGHGTAADQRRGNGETASTRSRSSIQTSTPATPSERPGGLRSAGNACQALLLGQPPLPRGAKLNTCSVMRPLPFPNSTRAPSPPALR